MPDIPCGSERLCDFGTGRVLKVKVCGIAGHGTPEMGKQYIVELPEDHGMPYEYTHASAFAKMLR